MKLSEQLFPEARVDKESESYSTFFLQSETDTIGKTQLLLIEIMTFS